MPPAAATAAARRSSGRRAAASVPGPRRVSGPIRPAKQVRRTAPAASRGGISRAGAIGAPPPLAFRLAGALHSLTEHRLIDRLVRGQMWIAIVGVGLIGIVFMQVSMLRMNTGIGRAVERAATLERDNAMLQASISRLSSSERITAAAARAGMIPASGATENFLDASQVSMRRAVNGITMPSSSPAVATTTPANSLEASAAAATQQPQVATTAPAGTTTAATSATASTTATTATGATATTTGATAAAASGAGATTQASSTQVPTPQTNTSLSVAGGAAATGP